MKAHNKEPQLGRHYEYTLELLAGRLVTPERYGVVAVEQEATLFQFPINPDLPPAA